MSKIEDLLETVDFNNIPLFGQPPALPDLTPQFLSMGKKGLVPEKTFRRSVRSAFSAPVERAPPKEEPDYAEAYGLFELESSFESSLASEQISSLETASSEVEALEQILSLSYKSPIEITAINELPITRKQVKEVHFTKKDSDWLSKVWVFKADPEATAKELTVYYIASKNGIPTGKPIGFQPSKDSYQFDIAILGGAVVEHAGDSYNKLIANMRLAPKQIHKTSQAIAKMIAEFHIKLTAAKPEFEEYGVNLEKSRPKKELEQRFLAALDIPEEKAETLIKACEDLYDFQQTQYIVSHCDLHTGNIVTKAREHSTSLQRFGVIDWGSIGLDTHYSDLRDFWLHHKRQVSAVCPDYDNDFMDFHNAYSRKARGVAEEKKLPQLVESLGDSLIQSALWNLYEMFDPVRTEDIEEKAKTHFQNLMQDLKQIRQWSRYTRAAETIQHEVTDLLREKGYHFS